MYNHWKKIALCSLGILALAACTPKEPKTVSQNPVKSIQQNTPTVIAEVTKAVTAEPTMAQGELPFLLICRNVEQMNDEQAVKYGKALSGKRITNWKGRVHKIYYPDLNTPLIEMEMNYLETNDQTEIADVALKGISPELIKVIKNGDILAFSAKIDSVSEVEQRKNMIILKDVSFLVNK